MLQARGRETAVVRLTGILKGTAPVTIRQRHPIPPVVKDLSELQQSDDGVVPLLVLLVKKPMQGPTVVIIVGVHWFSGGCWLWTGKANTAIKATMVITGIFDIFDCLSFCFLVRLRFIVCGLVFEVCCDEK